MRIRSKKRKPPLASVLLESHVHHPDNLIILVHNKPYRPRTPKHVDTDQQPAAAFAHALLPPLHQHLLRKAFLHLHLHNSILFLQMIDEERKEMEKRIAERELQFAEVASNACASEDRVPTIQSPRSQRRAPKRNDDRPRPTVDAGSRVPTLKSSHLTQITYLLGISRLLEPQVILLGLGRLLELKIVD
nr:hypothetical protein Iba_chr02eCG3680 [Ipomoea batatas]